MDLKKKKIFWRFLGPNLVCQNRFLDLLEIPDISKKSPFTNRKKESKNVV